MSAPLATRAGAIVNRSDASPGWWAMVWMIATEAALFAYLLFSYFYIASQSRGRWPPGGPLELRMALPNTAVLIASSLAFRWGERGIMAGDAVRLRNGVLVAFLLGLAFIIVQGLEWHDLAFGPRTDVHGSLFFTITGFHGAHVIVGLSMLLALLLWRQRAGLTAQRHLSVTVVGMYWHFVDIVWLFVFTALYLSPRWAS